MMTGSAYRFGPARPQGCPSGSFAGSSDASAQQALDVAAQLVAELGVASVLSSASMLVAHPGLHADALTNRFETPQVLVDELAVRCFQRGADMFADGLRGSGQYHWSVVVNRLIDCYTELFEQPLLREIWLHKQFGPRVRAVNRAWILHVADCALTELRFHQPSSNGITELQCITAIEVLDRLMRGAFEKESTGDARTIEEARVMVRSYLGKYAQDWTQRNT